jgi:hypothetical protein
VVTRFLLVPELDIIHVWLTPMHLSDLRVFFFNLSPIHSTSFIHPQHPPRISVSMFQPLFFTILRTNSSDIFSDMLQRSNEHFPRLITIQTTPTTASTNSKRQKVCYQAQYLPKKHQGSITNFDVPWKSFTFQQPEIVEDIIFAEEISLVDKGVLLCYLVIISLENRK